MTVGDPRVDVLVVDDRAEDLLAMQTVLAPDGYNVLTARSASEALRTLLAQEVAVILLDVVMPIMDGFELAALIKQRERTRETPIIFLTAVTPDLRQIYEGYARGAVDYLVKPADPTVLRAKVAIFADLFRKDQRLRQHADALQATERRERDLKLAELELAAVRRYRNLADAVPTIVWTARPDGGVDYVNRLWFEYTGLELEAARGEGWQRAVHGEDITRCEQAWQASLDSLAPYEVELRLRRADGVFRWHVGRALPERDDSGEVVAWLGTYSDTEDLKRAIRARDEFLSIASHELRTPLTGLTLRIDSLRKLDHVDPSVARRIEGAARQTERLHRLIDNLLDVSRITTGHLDLEFEECDLFDIARDVTERFREQAAASRTPIGLEGALGIRGSWDRLRIEQVVTNLLSNAVKYGAGRPVKVWVEECGEMARLSVQDQGIGISTEDLPRIFGQFERVAVRRYGGLGMGLYITRQIVDAHGGRVHVESRRGDGSRFTVDLPRRKVVDTDSTNDPHLIVSSTAATESLPKTD